MDLLIRWIDSPIILTKLSSIFCGGATDPVEMCPLDLRAKLHGMDFTHSSLILSFHVTFPKEVLSPRALEEQMAEVVYAVEIKGPVLPYLWCMCFTLWTCANLGPYLPNL